MTTTIKYEKYYGRWKADQNRLRKIARRKEIESQIKGTAWEVICRFKEAQNLLRLVYRRNKQATLEANPSMVRRDGVWQMKALRFLTIPTRHGNVVFKTTTRGMDVKRLRKQRNSQLRAVHMSVAWNTQTLPCSSDSIANEVNEDIATYLTDTLKWGDKHWFQSICPLYGTDVPIKHNSKKGNYSVKKKTEWWRRKNSDITG